VAWDCATGNGQAATHLTRYFRRVIATDESAEMISQAPRVPKIEYRVAEAEDSGLEEGSIDLVTVASAIHWFDLARFYPEVRRVVKPGGVVAAWTYYTPVFGDAIDAIIKQLAQDVLKDYWDERLHYFVDEFHDLPFPFEPIEAPPFRTDMRWNMEDLLGYFETWSSSVKYREAKGTHLTDLIRADAARVWGIPSKSGTCISRFTCASDEYRKGVEGLQAPLQRTLAPHPHDMRKRLCNDTCRSNAEYHARRPSETRK
jgi:SAM-dependent methyltransferase